MALRYKAKAPKGGGMVCFCPRCRKLHRYGVEWVGRGIPRIYCCPCMHTIRRPIEVDGIYWQQDRIAEQQELVRTTIRQAFHVPAGGA